MQLHMFWQNMLMPLNGIHLSEEGGFLIIPMPKGVHKAGRSFIRIYAWSDDYYYNDILIPLQDMKPVKDPKLLTRHDQQAQVLYSVLIDRFENGNKANDWKMNSDEVLDIVDYQGGDLAGITKKIEEGYFDKLGVNTLWISPITQNPWDAWGCYPFKNGNKYDATKTYTKFSGYHGYWPIFATKLDSRFGTPEELHTLLRIAHAHEMNVVLDYVANHMHINSPTCRSTRTGIRTLSYLTEDATSSYGTRRV